MPHDCHSLTDSRIRVTREEEPSSEEKSRSAYHIKRVVSDVRLHPSSSLAPCLPPPRHPPSLSSPPPRRRQRARTCLSRQQGRRDCAQHHYDGVVMESPAVWDVGGGATAGLHGQLGVSQTTSWQRGLHSILVCPGVNACDYHRFNKYQGLEGTVN